MSRFQIIPQGGQPLIYLPLNPAAALRGLELFATPTPRERLRKTALWLGLKLGVRVGRLTDGLPFPLTDSFQDLVRKFGESKEASVAVLVDSTRSAANLFICMVMDEHGGPKAMIHVGVSDTARECVRRAHETLSSKPSPPGMPKALELFETDHLSAIVLGYVPGNSPVDVTSATLVELICKSARQMALDASGQTGRSPQFSIVTPSLGQLGWLQLCAASVADQVGVTVEHIIQDGGTQGVETLFGTAKLGSNHQLRLCQEPDTGMYDAINKGLLKAQGEICAYLNCDEQYLPEALSDVATFFKNNPEVEVLFGDAVLLDSNGRPFSYRRTVIPHADHTKLIHLSTPSCATFFRRSLVDRGLLFDTNWKALGDLAWVNRLLEQGIKMACYRCPLAAFTFTGQNLGASSLSIAEGQRWHAARPPVCTATRLWTTLRHRVRKLFAGAYLPRSLNLRVYVLGFKGERTFFRLSGFNFRWPKQSPDSLPATSVSEVFSKEPPKIAAVFATFGRRSLAIEALKSLKRQTRPLDFIVVADNASIDGTADALQQEGGLEIVRLKENVGNPEGVRIAVERALELGANWVWILDDDAFPRPDALEKLLGVGLSASCVLGSLVLGADGKLSWPYSVVRSGRKVIAETPEQLPTDDCFEARGIWLAALISRELLLQTGPINGDLFIRGEDEEYTARIREIGGRFLCVKSSVVEHPVATGLIRVSLFGKNFFYEPGLPFWKAYYKVRNTVYVRRKHTRPALLGWVEGVISAGLFLLLAITADDQRLRRLLVYIRAGWDGLIGRLGKNDLANPAG